MAAIRNGEIIKDMLYTKTDNSKHVYVVRWLIDGKPRFVSVDDYVPGKNGASSFSKSKDGIFWGIIIEKAWAKIFGNYMKTEAGTQKNVWKAIT